MSAKKKIYITTPLYYVNAAPHIGHAYTTLAADILARFHRSKGRDVHFLTGTDEHGSKIEEVATAAGIEPRAYADKIASEFSDMWKHLGIQHDDFIRTTEDRHVKRVQAVFEHLLANEDIYKGVYKGYYCVSCETYWTETEAPPNEDSGKRHCQNKDCGKELTLTEEESYFFKLSKYEKPLLEHYEKNPGFLMPKNRSTEIVNFVKEGLRDLAVSRTKVQWGIPVTSDPKHVVYVWFDALQNYITATGYRPPGMEKTDEEDNSAQLWPADIHFVGKEIYRFHAVIWPAMLMALGVELPKCVYAHGWWTVEGQKMSKSKGNFVDPKAVTSEFSVDVFRYHLFREMPFGNDGDFSVEKLLQRYNAELANDLGNLVSRVTNMVDKYCDGTLPENPPQEKLPTAALVAAAESGIDAAFEGVDLQEALNKIWAEVGRLNRLVNDKEPWKMAKTDMEGVRWLLCDLVASLQTIAGWIAPVMPEVSKSMQSALTGEIRKIPPMFPRKEAA